MLSNYLKVAVRNLFRQKGYSFINIAGLAAGMACFILIALWVFHELSYDRFHEKMDRIYRVNTTTPEYGLVTSSSLRLGPAMKQAYPEIEQVTRVWPWARSLVSYKGKWHDEPFIHLVDSTFFTIFTFPMIAGKPEEALPDKYSAVLSESAAKRIFGDDDAYGKMIYSREFDRDFKVTAIIKDVPQNSSFQFEIIGRVDLMPEQRLQSWEFTGYTYLLLQQAADHKSVNEKIAAFYKDHVNPESEYAPVLQELSSIHLYQQGKPGLIKLVYIFSAVAVFILLIACINFMNLSTARASKRAGEIGVRKAIGAQRKQLISQFLAESVLIALLALMIALLIVQLVLPAFNQLSGEHLALFAANMPLMTLFLLAVALITGLIAGSYPAFFLSAFKPVNVLKMKNATHGRGKSMRSGLMVFQFALAVVLIISAFMVRQQLHYIQSRDMGIDRDFIIQLPGNADLNAHFDSYRNELLKHPSVLNVTSAQNQPIDVSNYIEVNWEGSGREDGLPMAYTTVEYDFFATFDISFAQGRPFSRQFASDQTNACIINQTARRQMQLESPIGKKLYFDHPAFPEELKSVTIIGVVEDFHIRSLHEPIGPFIIRMYKPYQTFIYIKIRPDHIPNTMAYLKRVTLSSAPDFPFYYEFLDDVNNRLYQQESTMRLLFQGFALLAIFISCLGLLGLTAFTLEQRRKEIGIRRVLGASVAQIAGLIHVQFIARVSLAIVLAWPVAWFLMHRWLQNFAYHTNPGIWTFMAAAVLVLAITLVTVSLMAIRAALAHPAESLRYE
ncbi:ABC transporter permease [candidate division KSB1 bacterium]|nr:ABC transporter permease [candidate division KSB1 bacterium]